MYITELKAFAQIINSQILEMNVLFNDPAFWKTEEELKGRDPKQYDKPGDEENYSLLASNDDPAVIAAKSLTRKRKNKIRCRLNNAKRPKKRRVENCEFGLANCAN